jgi:hypothetical protein
MIPKLMSEISISRLTGSLLLAATAFTTFAGPLDQSKVAADAKWVVHLDFDAFRKSKLGNHFVTKIIEPKLKENDLFQKANLSLSLTNISGLTAYGPNYEKDGDGVLLLSTTADLKKDMDTLVGMAAVSGNETKDVTMVQQQPFPIYNVKNDFFVAPLSGNTVLLAKSRDQVDRAREIVSGKGENLAKGGAFKDYPEAPSTFFFSAMAQSFNESAHIPPQAQVLRETDGGRFVIGENEKNIFLNVVFKGKDQEATTKIQQVLQGIVALVSMSQKNPEITELASSAKIIGEERNVSVTLQFPTAKAIEQVEKNVKVKQDNIESDAEAAGSSPGKEEETGK